MEQLQERSISVQQVDEVLQSTQQIIHEAGYTIFHQLLNLGEGLFVAGVFEHEHHAQQSHHRLQNIQNWEIPRR